MTSGFLHAAGGQLRDGDGTPVLLRGVGLGNWLLPEGYMWRFEPPGPQSPRRIEALVADLVGPERSAQFWAEFRDRFITERDIAAIAAAGFDHVRLPINWRVIADERGVLTDGIDLVDRTVEWCRRHGITVLLDLHGAPGGQTGTNIDDSPNEIPELFGDRRWMDLTVAIWAALAERYAHDPTVAGYDLLNEPLPDEYQHRYAAELVALYRELTAAIRAVDRDHLLMYEGMHWATNWSIFDAVWDDNSVLQFHKYWSPPDRPSIQRFVDIGARLGLPIYMGEGGENNPAWIQTAFQLYEDLGIGWNFWPWKKLDTATSPCSVIPPPGWVEVVAYAAGRGPRPNAAAVWETLCRLLDAVDVENCESRSEIVNAMFRRPPVRIPATGFGFRGRGVSWSTTSATPLSGFRADDDVTIVAGRTEPRFDHNRGEPRDPDDTLDVVLAPGDWVSYTVTGPVAGVEFELVDGSSVPDVATTNGGGTTTIRVTAGDTTAVLRSLDVR